MITADLHLSDNPRDAYRLDWMDQLQDFIKRNETEHLIVLGDLCEEKDRHGAWLVNAIVDRFAALAKLCTSVTILKGNHDYISVDTPFFGFLGRIDNLIYIDKPIDGNETLYLPHTPNYKRDWAGIKLQDYKYVFCHNTFQDADVGYGRKLDGIPTDLFRADQKVISGDVHVPQKIGPVTYVGAPYTIDFGDDYQGRVLLIEHDRLKSLRLHGPQKRLIEANSFEELEKQAERDDLHDGDIIKVRMLLNHSDYQAWPEVQKKVRAWGEKNHLEIHVIQPVFAQASVNQRKRDADKLTDAELLEEYAKHRGVDDRTLKTGKLLMGE